ncbi:carbohydrate ABC transporter permease [Tessaracoccus oleiagri]|uniref:Raffinose/stachyose/melibiose transport system permease protein n=1 Tax=Tessaracoccus oleiagri TaxID=686624 RepID=A0A1G9KGP8_9ACTN|nr:carbohydrate ABC transporter permease [Tessaracoccus oleiagri]SDL49080.1 raffinose/stachyose/melibiose transport system permease protein [Tessaracoccus oleiagri]
MRVSAGEKALNYVVLTLFSLFALFPVITIVVTALGPQLGVAESGPHWGNIVDAWNQGSFGPALLRSLLVALLVVPVALVLSILAGYAFGTMRFRGSTFLFYVFLFGMMVPAEAIIIPLFYDMRALGLTDTIWAIALPQIAQSIAFGTFWMRAQFRAMPPNLVEAAAIDGTSGLTTLWRIMVPPAIPSIATVTVLMFMWTWNEFLIPLVMSPGATWRTAPLGLSVFKGQYTADGALIAAAGLIVAAPIVAVFLLMQRYFISGMLEGAAKE